MISLRVVLFKFLLQSVWSISSEFLFSDCFGPCLLCNQLSSDVSGLDYSYLSMSLHNRLKALCVGDVSQGRPSWKWPLWCGVSSITICRPFVWGCLVPPEKYPLISCLGWSVCGRLEQGRDLAARGLKIEQPRYRIVPIQHIDCHVH